MPKPKPPSALEEIERRLAEGRIPPIARTLGFRLAKIRKGRATIEFRAGPEHANPMGTLHGGLLCDIADASMGMSFASLLRADDSFTTIELKINFLRPFWSGRLLAEGRVIRKGRSLGLLECRVVDDHGKLVAYATSTCMTVEGSKGGGLTRPRKGARQSRGET